MKLKLLFTILLLSGISVFSQTKYETGYIIKTNGQKIDCLIKNEDWKGSPTSFEYKVGENGDVQIGNLSNIKEFGSGDYFKYISATLPVEQSNDNVDDLNLERNPTFKEETHFLKVLAEGKASLYYMIKDGYNRFFYKLDDGEIEQLIYKRYLTNDKRIAENNRYKQQLATDLACSTLQQSNFDNLTYKKTSLINQFKKYNTCLNSEVIVYKKNDFKHGFNLHFRPGVTFGSASIQKAGQDRIDFDNKTGYRIGLEAEYIFGFNNGKWSIFMEPTYRNYKAEKELLYVDFITIKKTTLITVEYNSIEIPLGARYYMFLNKDSAFFINAAFVVDLTKLDSDIVSSNEGSYDLYVKSGATTAFGGGFRFKNKISIEARYHSSRKIINYNNILATHESFSIIAGYNFL